MVPKATAVSDILCLKLSNEETGKIVKRKFATENVLSLFEINRYLNAGLWVMKQIISDEWCDIRWEKIVFGLRAGQTMKKLFGLSRQRNHHVDSYKKT